jgi:K+-transporting ATPase ATPase A chain
MSLNAPRSPRLRCEMRSRCDALRGLRARFPRTAVRSRHDGWLHIILILVLVAGGAYPLGRFMATLFEGGRTFLSPLLSPIERGLYRLAGIDPEVEQDWLTYTLCMLAFAGGCFILLYAILRLQNVLPLNPQGFDAVPPDLVFNTWNGVAG